MNTQQVKLGSVVSFNPRLTQTDLPADTKVAYVTLSTVSASSGQVAPETRMLSDIEAGYCHFQDGDLLVANQLIALQDGKVAQAHINLEHGFCSKKLYVIRPDASLIDSRYLLHFLRQTRMRMLVSRYLRNEIGRHPPALDFLKNLTLALPPLAEQKRLAALLDLAFDCCSARRREIVTIDRMRQAHFIKLFGDADTIFEHWPMSTLGEQLDEVILGSRRWTQYKASKGDLLIRRCNLGSNRMLLEDMTFVRVPHDGATPFNETHRTRVLAGDVLLSVAANLGRTAVVADDLGTAYVNQGVAILRTTSVDSSFLAAFLSSSAGLAEIDRVKNDGPTPTLNLAAIRSIRLPLPSLEMQLQFARECDAFERERNVVGARLEQDQEYFAALERATFGGTTPGEKHEAVKPRARTVFTSSLLDLQ